MSDQPYHETEVIVVDYGFTHHSRENGGQASALNTGLHIR